MAFSLRLFSYLKPPASPKGVSNLSDLSQVKSMPALQWNSAQFDNLSSASLRQKILLTEDRILLDDIEAKHAKLLKKAKQVLMSKVRENKVEVLYMIDAIQRLGIEYHFEVEIAEALQRQHLMFKSHFGDHELYEVALQFRLLRQEGHYVHAGVFNNIMDNEGKLKEKIGEDIMGLLGLHEAAQLSAEGEDDLDEAGKSAHQLLEIWVSSHHDHNLAKVVSDTLQLPFHKSLPRFLHRSYCLNDSQFKMNKGWASTLQELAKVDSCIVKSIHQQEILQVSKWWRDLALARELKFVRNEPIKWYMWVMACLTDPQFSEQRIDLTKPLSLVYIIDDIFDVYGSIDTLALFNDAVNRWELEATEQLPVYLKICFKALYDITNEFAYKVYIKHGWNPIGTLQKLWARLCNAFLLEAQWFDSGHLPKAKEYIKNGVISTGVEVVLGHALFLLEQGKTRETVALMNGTPHIISSVGTILRLSDDLEGSMDKNQDGHDGSYLKCYMEETEGISAEETRVHVYHLISDAWRSLNQECLSPTPYSASYKKICLNAARMVPFMYNSDGNHSVSILKDHMRSLLYDIGAPTRNP